MKKTQWKTGAYKSVKSIGTIGSDRLNDGKIASANGKSGMAYHFTNLDENSTGAAALKYIASHPGATRAETSAALKVDNFNGFYAALEQTDLIGKVGHTGKHGAHTMTLSKKGQSLVNDIFGR